MFKELLEFFTKQFIKRAGRKPQTPAEVMSIQNDVVRYINETKGKGVTGSVRTSTGDVKPIPDPFQGFTPKVIQGGKSKEGIGTLFKDSPERIAQLKADNKAAIERLKEKTKKDDFASGGMARVGMFGGGLLKKFLLNKKTVRKAVDDIFPTGDYKYDAEMAAEALVENNPKFFKNKLYDDLSDADRMEVYGSVLSEVQNDLAKMLEARKLSKPTKTLEGIKKEGTIDISNPEVADEFSRFMKESDPEGFKDIEQKIEIEGFNVKDRKPNASGGRAGSGLNYLLGEDDQNVRMPSPGGLPGLLGE